MPSQLFPFRDSRHRRACLALYKALLRQGLRVPLPDDVATGLGPVNPIRSLIRNGFRRNRKDTSLRLVNSALANGYKYLALFASAQDPTVPEHASVLTFLRENQVRVLAVRAKIEADLAVRVLTRPGPDLVPLLRLVPKEPGDRGPPEYVATNRPRPLSEIKGGIRKVPTLDDSQGFPFLRLTKPQSPYLSRMIRQTTQRAATRTLKLIELQKEGTVDAGLEDQWDKLIDRLRAQDLPTTGYPLPPPNSYVAPLTREIKRLAIKLNRAREHQVARGTAMWKIVEQEKELARKEAKKRREKLRKARRNERRELEGTGPGSPLAESRKVVDLAGDLDKLSLLTESKVKKNKTVEYGLDNKYHW
ncbi:hypothetical protein B0T22DRAFT_370024 [Podospora appendiculata]|uniref:Complex 1 LYR protein domain-containing protein n=1 Tax=Podospora appendiculata TaxID=314037 RepID=A0AAE0XGP4_9PEZI|nr:hypothetical protein B0T22DRAFT_370024 [Podospora appendiculata]